MDRASCKRQSLAVHNSAAKWHRELCRGATSISGGTVSQIAFAIGQRVLKRQPLGMFNGLGISPVVTAARWRFTRLIFGTAFSKARV
jgi:hypothetical protein